jgi:predicted MFS family arabinose efflux permease
MGTSPYITETGIFVNVSESTANVPTLTPAPRTGGQAALVSVFQIAIAVGATVGGAVFDRSGIQGIAYLGAAFCAVTVVLSVLPWQPAAKSSV